MKTILIIPCFFILILTGSGCASSNYLLNRGRDAADIFTVTVGEGYGGKVRVGPIHVTPLMFHNDATGLRGGCRFRAHKGSPALADHGVDDVGFLFFASSEVFARKGYGPQWETSEKLSMVELRGKSFEVESFIPFVSIPGSSPKNGDDYIVYPSYYWTQAEVVVAVGVSLRLGFNLGELIDFILGWTTLDIYRDDVAARSGVIQKAPIKIGKE